MDIGQFLRELRKAKGLSLRQVEKNTGVSNSYLSLVETGKRPASPEILRKLADLYDVSIREMLIRAGILPDKDKRQKEHYRTSIEQAHRLFLKQLKKSGEYLPEDLEEAPFEFKEMIIALNRRLGNDLLSSAAPVVKVSIEHVLQGTKFEMWIGEEDLERGLLVEKSIVPKLTEWTDSNSIALLERNLKGTKIDNGKYFNLLSLFELEYQLQEIHELRKERLRAGPKPRQKPKKKSRLKKSRRTKRKETK